MQEEIIALKDFEIVRGIKRDLIRKRTEIGKMKNGTRKTEAMKIYAQLLTTFEMGYVS